MSSAGDDTEPADAQGPGEFSRRRDVIYASIGVCIAMPALIYMSFSQPKPVGIAGLYSLMADRIVADHFHLPTGVPLYGPGGIPFAYPPLGLYVMALATAKLGIPVLAYLRFAPSIFATMYLVPLLFLYRRLGVSHTQATISTVLAAVIQPVLNPHFGAPGAVRGLAFFMALAELLVTLKALDEQRFAVAVSAACLFGLTILTHLPYAVFFAASLGALAFCRRPTRRGWRQASIILLGGVVFSAP